MLQLKNAPGTQQSSLKGLIPMVAIVSLVLLSPVVFFTIELVLGNAHMFAVNGAK